LTIELYYNFSVNLVENKDSVSVAGECFERENNTKINLFVVIAVVFEKGRYFYRMSCASDLTGF
jgi:hypothetical protein